MAKTTRVITGAELRKFRSDIARLKKAGFVSPYIDARSVKPTARLKTKVTKFDDFLSGKTTPVALPKGEVDKYRKLGYQISSGKVMMPHSINEKVIVNKKTGNIELDNQKTGFRFIQLPIEYHNLPDYLRKVKQNNDEIQRMKRNRESFSFRFHGMNTRTTYSDIDLLIEDFERYDAVQAALVARGTKRAKEGHDVYRNLEIVVVSSKSAWQKDKDDAIAAAKKRFRSSKRQLKLRRAYEHKPHVMSKNAERQKLWRDSLSPAEKEKYKKAARKRKKKNQPPKK